MVTVVVPQQDVLEDLGFVHVDAGGIGAGQLLWDVRVVDAALDIVEGAHLGRRGCF